MEAEILKTVGQVAGIGGLAVGALIILFREIIRKNIFPNLIKEQAYKLLRLIIILAWTVAILGIVTWAYVETNKNSASSETKNQNISIATKKQQVSGLVTDEAGNGLSDVDIFIVGGVDRVKTTSSGSFILNISGNDGDIINLQANKDLYISWNENVKIPNTSIRIVLKKTSPPQTNNNQVSLNNSFIQRKTADYKKQRPQLSPSKSNSKSGIIQQSSSKPSNGEQDE